MPENVEIERRFLVDGRFEEAMDCRIVNKIHITQWYLEADLFTASETTCSLSYDNIVMVADVESALCQTISQNPNWTVRLRNWNNTYFLTLKGARKGATATEYEWEIAADVAESLFRILTIHTSRKIAICGTERTRCFGKSMNLKAI